MSGGEGFLGQGKNFEMDADKYFEGDDFSGL